MMNNQATSRAATSAATTASSTTLLVGVGASAGGLEAFQALLVGLGEAPGVAIVFVRHLEPHAESMLMESLAGSTSLEIVEVTKRTKLKPNAIYICPPHALPEVQHGSLLFTEQADKTLPAAPIDHFFRSLAESQGEKGIGIILSGAGSDGTLGLKSISDCGGMTFAQEPASAKFDAMPRSAATTGVADHVLPPDRIAQELTSYVTFLSQSTFRPTSPSLHEEIELAIPEIAEQLLQATDHNFQHYKTSTLGRRILRRMQVLKIAKVANYVALIKEDQQETQLLFRELLIGVTAFFRDPQSFERLSQMVLPKLFAGRPSDDLVRIWVPGCATGEEAYTLAMLCQECLDKQHTANLPAGAGEDQEPSTASFQIFASDIDERALCTARQGIYPVGIADDVSPERLERFFVLKGKRYHVRHELREKVIFSSHNLISDPPYSRQDMISCRNLLIYLGPHLQKKLIPLFHYALQPNGFLFLGPSESMTSHGELFRAIDAKHRISQRRETAITRGAALSLPSYSDSHRSTADVPSTDDNRTDIVQVMQRIVLDEFAPKVVVIDDDGQVICSSAETNKYLSIGEGTYQNNILKMARRGLRLGLRAAINQAKAKRRRVTHENVSVETDQGKQPVMLTVQPMMQMGEESGLFLVVFHDVGLPMNLSINPPTSEEDLMARGKLDRAADLLIEQLERELSSTRDDLDRTLQEMEATNEELKSSNEELLSMNEELQSANEELETSKEEIQAALDRIARSDMDRQNLLDSTKIATLFVDDELHIRSFTTGMTAIYNFIPADVGRPLQHTTHTVINMPAYPADPTQVYQWPLEDEVESQSGRWFLRRIQPYLTADLRRDGMVVTFYDITEQVKLRMRLAAAHGVASLLADADSFETVIPEVLRKLRQSLAAEACLLWLVDEQSQRLKCIESDAIDDTLQPFLESSRQMRFASGEGLPGSAWKNGKPVWFEDIRKSADFVRVEAAIACNLSSGVATPIVIGAKFKGVIEIYTTRQQARDPELLNMLKTIGNDVGQFIRRRRLDAMFRDEEARKTAILQSALDCIITMDTQGSIIEFNPAAEQAFGYTLAEVSGQQLSELIIPPEYRQAHNEGLARFLRTGSSTIFGKRIELTAMRSDGSQFPIELAINVSHGRDGMPFFTAYLRDITQQRKFEASLHDARAQAVAANESKSEFLANMSHEIRTPMTAILGYADLLREYITAPEAIDHLSTIRRNGDYLLDIINDILDLSKIEAGKLEVLRERFDPTRLVEDVRSIMEVRATENNLQLEVIYDGRIPARIESDGKRLKQILINLVGNAIKFTPHGSVKLLVRALRSPVSIDQSATDETLANAACALGSNRTHQKLNLESSSANIESLQFTIIDTGIGMNDEQLKRLFKPFEQGDSSVSRHFGGTGLGLAISRRLAAMLGGQIEVESVLGQGSTFQVTVAVGEVADVPLVLPSPFIAAAPKSTAEPPIKLNCYVLVVDDRRDIRFLSKRLLTQAGATVDECEDGQIAVDFVRTCIAQKCCPALILLDMQMPNLDGYETARQLRQLGFTGPIIALTADAMQGDMNRCIECGCNDYLSKPIDAGRLLRLVAQMTNQMNNS